ncbi:MAG: transposase [Chthoniobacteraceae bacterium]|nr:transposase [Chthoniobacteraceae bacterium]
MIREERISFTWHERQRLSAVMRGVRDARQHRRLMAVWLIAQGQSPGETAGFLGYSHRWVNKCLARYLERRCPQDLAERPRAGRPRASVGLTAERLRDVVQSDPFLWGYASTTWTVPLLTTHLKEHLGCVLSKHTLRRRMREAGCAGSVPATCFQTKSPTGHQKKGDRPQTTADAGFGGPCNRG